MSLYVEYLRRNLLVAGAIGASAAADTALDRLRENKHAPKWLIDHLEAIKERTDKLPADLAAWRDLANDRPDYVRPLADPGAPLAPKTPAAEDADA